MRAIGEVVFGPLARAFGYRLVPRRRLRYWYEIELTRRLLEHLDVDCVYDVGANRGQFRDQLRDDVGWSGRIVSVEPQPALAARLRERTAGDPDWDVHECALGPAAGRATFNLMAGDVYGSFLAPDEATRFADAAANRVVGTVEVEVRRLDDLHAAVVAAHGVRRPFLKLDTQGYDLQVLAGAGRMLADVVALQTELSFRPLYRGMPTWRESITRLGELGFEVSGFTPIEPRAQFPRALEMNGFFVSARHARD